MAIQSLSVVVGTKACDAQCPFCISKITGFGPVHGVGSEKLISALDVDTDGELGPVSEPRPLSVASYARRSLRKAMRTAVRGGCTTALITGKGEPTLYPDRITAAVKELASGESGFDFIELQTNGIGLYHALCDGSESKRVTIEHLREWRLEGLTTIALSTAGFVNSVYGDLSERLLDLNEKHYWGGGDKVWLPFLMGRLQSQFGFTVRLCVMAQRGGVDTLADVQAQVRTARELDVDQLTIRPITEPQGGGEQADPVAIQYIRDNQPECFTSSWGTGTVPPILAWARKEGKLLRTLAGGGEVYEVYGQNLGIYNCLTVDKGTDQRSLIVYPSGEVTSSWVYRRGTRVLGPAPAVRRKQAALDKE